MHKRNRLFILLSLAYALIGGAVALVWLARPGAIAGDVARLHGHIMLLGFVAMMIYGIGLHVLPRVSGRPLYSERLANWQLYASNLGLWVMAVGWLTWRNAVVFAGGAVTWLGFLLFASNIFLTLKPYGPKG